MARGFGKGSMYRCDWARNHLNAKTADFSSLLYHNLTTIYYLYHHNKIFITNAEFNGLSSVAYGNEI